VLGQSPDLVALAATDSDCNGRAADAVTKRCQFADHCWNRRNRPQRDKCGWALRGKTSLPDP